MGLVPSRVACRRIYVPSEQVSDNIVPLMIQVERFNAELPADDLLGNGLKAAQT